MMISELLAKMENQFPGSPVAAWGDDYKRVLKPFAGPALGRAWTELMKTWDKGFAPKPAEILKFCRHERGRGTERHVEGREGWVQVERRTDEITDDWFRDNPPIVERASAEGWLLLLKDHIRKIAFSAAQQESLGKQNCVQAAFQRFERESWITESEMVSMRERAEAWAVGPVLEARSGPRPVTRCIGGEWRRTA